MSIEDAFYDAFYDFIVKNFGIKNFETEPDSVQELVLLAFKAGAESKISGKIDEHS